MVVSMNRAGCDSENKGEEDENEVGEGAIDFAERRGVLLGLLL